MDPIIIPQRIQDTIKSLAQKSQHKYKVGAAIVKGRKIVSLGHNSHKTSPYIKHNISDTTLVDRLHAEMSCICKSQNDISGSKIYVGRLSPSGFKNARPCKLCMSMIREAGIKEVYYSTNDGWKRELV